MTSLRTLLAPKLPDTLPLGATRRAAPFLAALMGMVALASCSNDGRTLRAPSPNQTRTVKTTTTTAAPAASAVLPPGSEIAGMSITGPWDDGAAVPERHTCKGTNVSPAVQWSGLPSDAAELALVLTDLTLDGRVIWAIAGLDPGTNGITEGRVPRGAIVAVNDKGAATYNGPCPDSGQHTYLLTFYALKEPSKLTATATGSEARARLDQIALSQTSLTGVYPA